MKTRIFFFTVILLNFCQTPIHNLLEKQMVAWGGETTQNTEDQYRNDRFGGGIVQTNSPLPNPDPDTRIKPYIPNTPPTGGQGPRFDKIPSDHKNAPIFSKFKRVFLDCAPIDCDMGRGHCFGTRGKASCHTTGDAIDLHSIRCNGQDYDSNHPVFVKLVECIQTRFHEGRRWKALHQDKGGKCAGVGPHSKISKVTSCHWNHAHFSVGCRRSGNIMW